MFCSNFHALTKWSQMHPNTMKRTETFVIIALVHLVLHRHSCCYETIPKAPKYCETEWNICLGSTKVDWVCLLRKIPSLRDDPKWTQTLWNTPKYEFRVKCGGSGLFICEKLQRDFVGRTFVLTAPVQYVLHLVSCSYETIPNAPKYYETNRNISLESKRVDWVRFLREIPMWHHGTNFYINCTSSPRFAPSFMQLRNDPIWTQTLWNAIKHEFKVQWGESGAFVAKHYNVTSWDELLY